MDTAEQERPIEQRVQALETAVVDMRGMLLKLAADLDSLKNPVAAPQTRDQIQPQQETQGIRRVPVTRQVAPAASPPPPPPLAQVYCPRCHGGNSPLADRCQWCGLALRWPAASSPVPAQAPTPAGPGAQAAFEQRPAQQAGAPPPNYYAPGTAQRGPAPAGRALTPSARPASSPMDMMKRTEFWLNKVGIVLFLFGVAFLFKYAVDQGWLTEEVRLGCGIALGTGLLGFGLWLRKSRPALSQVLLGGSVATYYITAYAAYMIFTDLQIPFGLIFGFVAAVTLMAFVLSLVYGAVSMSLVGVTGGLLTPFVLMSRLDLPALIAYTCLILALASGIYLFRGWRSVLWVAFFGGWLILLAGYVSRVVFTFDSGALTQDRWALQAGAAFMLVAFWAVPVLREVLTARDPARWARTTLSPTVDPGIRLIAERHVRALTVLTPFSVYVFSTGLWSGLVTQEEWGWIGIAGGIIFGLVFFGLRKIDSTLAYVHMVVGVSLLTIGLSALLASNGDVLLVALSVEAAALVLVAHTFSDEVALVTGEILYVPILFFVLSRLATPRAAADLPMLNMHALVDLFALALPFAISFIARPREVGMVLRVAVHLGVLGLLVREFIGLERGFEDVMLAWAIYAVLMHAAATFWPRFTQPEKTEFDRGAHVISAAAGLGLLLQMVSGLLLGNQGSDAIFNISGLVDLGVLAAGVAALYLAWRRHSERRVLLAYAIWLHVAFLGWMWQEIGRLPSGNGWVTIAWGIYALALLAAWIGVRRDNALFYAGISTMFAVAAKLFLIDLRYLDTIWRILLFLGFGSLFLVLSYFFGGSITRMLSKTEEASASSEG